MWGRLAPADFMRPPVVWSHSGRCLQEAQEYSGPRRRSHERLGGPCAWCLLDARATGGPLVGHCRAKTR